MNTESTVDLQDNDQFDLVHMVVNYFDIEHKKDLARKKTLAAENSKRKKKVPVKITSSVNES